MKTKPKQCKGIGKAKGFKGCGKISAFRKYGLCPSCLSDWANQTDEGKAFLKRVALKGKKDTDRKRKAENRKQKLALKRTSKLKEELQQAVNKIARLIDIDKPCISCNHGATERFNRQAHGGHYKSVGGHPSVRFNLHNIHKQCSICNNYYSANELNYRKGLIERYGEDYLNKVEGLEAKYPVLKLSRTELEEAVKTARAIVREIEKGTDYTREEVNRRLGIYK